MSTSFRGNWLDKLVAFVPGYKGYKEQPVRRSTDRLLRESIVKRLGEGKNALDRAAGEALLKGVPGAGERVAGVKASIDALILRVKTVSPGYSGLFEAFTIETVMIYRLYRYDIAVRDRTEEVAILMGGLPAAKNPGDMLDQIAASVQLVGEALLARDHAVGEIK